MLRILSPILLMSSIVLLINLNIALAGSRCPFNQKRLDPCSCEEVRENTGKRFTLVVCNGVTKSSQLRNISQALDRMVLDRIVIRNSSFENSSSWELGPVIIREIVIRNFKSHDCNWGINSSWPGFYDSLKSLRINNLSNPCCNPYDQGFDKFYNLENLDLSSSIASPTLHAFPSALPNLRSLDLSYNALIDIEEGAFSNVPLSRLNLSHNEISEINRLTFENVTDTLVELDLSWNPLLSLPHDFFVDMNLLQKLHLRHTLIQVIDRFVVGLSKSRNLQFIDLSENLINCNCTMSWAALSASRTSDLKTKASLNVKGQCKNPRTLEFHDIQDTQNYRNCSGQRFSKETTETKLLQDSHSLGGRGTMVKIDMKVTSVKTSPTV